jgi:hypothetical protein
MDIKNKVFSGKITEKIFFFPKISFKNIVDFGYIFMKIIYTKIDILTTFTYNPEELYKSSPNWDILF